MGPWLFSYEKCKRFTFSEVEVVVWLEKHSSSLWVVWYQENEGNFWWLDCSSFDFWLVKCGKGEGSSCNEVDVVILPE